MKIKLKEYERIHQIIKSIILGECADPLVSCTFFAFYGAYVLKKHYKLKAEVKVGLAAYHVGVNCDAILFGEKIGDEVTSSITGFHCWVECDGWAIDFMAPLFSEIAKQRGASSLPSPKMFQKPMEKMEGDLASLRGAGDFFYGYNTELLVNRFEYMSSRNAYSDLAEICSTWYKKRTKKDTRIYPNGRC